MSYNILAKSDKALQRFYRNLAFLKKICNFLLKNKVDNTAGKSKVLILGLILKIF